MSDMIYEKFDDGIDERIEAVALTGAPDGDIADYFGISVGELRARFGDDLRQFRARRRIGLLRQLSNFAFQGDVKALLFFAKLELSERDDDWSMPELRPKYG